MTTKVIASVFFVGLGLWVAIIGGFFLIIHTIWSLLK